MDSLPPEVTDSLLIGLHSASYPIQRQTLIALGKIGPEAVIINPPVISQIKFLVLNGMQPIDLRIKGLYTLVKINPDGEKIKPIIQEAVKSSDVQIRRTAEDLLSQLK